jgi:hypothetical protein
VIDVLSLLRSWLTTESTEWYETLPYYCGIFFVLIEFLSRVLKKRRPLFSAPAFAYMFSEGITICVMPIYAGAPAFDHGLATAIADKNGKVLIVAMLVAFVTLLVHVINQWLHGSAEFDSVLPH